MQHKHRASPYGLVLARYVKVCLHFLTVLRICLDASAFHCLLTGVPTLYIPLEAHAKWPPLLYYYPFSFPSLLPSTSNHLDSLQNVSLPVLVTVYQAFRPTML